MRSFSIDVITGHRITLMLMVPMTFRSVDVDGTGARFGVPTAANYKRHLPVSDQPDRQFTK